MNCNIISRLSLFSETRTHVEDYETMEVDEGEEQGQGPQRCKFSFLSMSSDFCEVIAQISY